MTHASAFILLLREGPKTLPEILHANGGQFCAEYRKIKTLLNQGGYDIRYHRLRKHGGCTGCWVTGFEAKLDCPAKMRGEACYHLHAEPPVVEATGQRVVSCVSEVTKITQS